NDNGRKIDPSNLVVSTDYIKGTDLAGSSMGHQQVSEIVLGRNLVMTSDCQSCHKINEPSIGPSYMQISQRYKGKKVTRYLTDKILNGSSGVWGDRAMPAHPGMKDYEARQIIQWITSLTDDRTDKQKSLPMKGAIVTKKHENGDEEAVLRIRAQYINTPEQGIKPLSGSKTVDLRPAASKKTR